MRIILIFLKIIFALIFFSLVTLTTYSDKINQKIIIQSNKLISVEAYKTYDQVVAVRFKSKFKNIARGAGVLVKIKDQSSGKEQIAVITACHCLDKNIPPDLKDYSIIAKASTQEEMKLIVLKKFPNQDIAILLVDNNEQSKITDTAKIGQIDVSSLDELGRDIWVWGYPSLLNNNLAVVHGIISNIENTESHFGNFLKGPQVFVDAETSPGFSGGPVFDNKGLLIGTYVAHTKVESEPYHYGMFIPITTTIELLKQENFTLE